MRRTHRALELVYQGIVGIGEAYDRLVRDKAVIEVLQAVERALPDHSYNKVHDIPVADPVKLQGVVTIVLLALLLVMLVGLGFGLRMILSRGGEEHVEVPVPALPTNPLTQPGSPTQPAPGPMVAGDVRIDPPVVYVLDAGGSMSEAYGFAALMTGVSIRSLGNERCNIVVCREAGDRKWSPRSHTGGAAAQAAARKFMEGIIPAGATSIARGFQTALAMKPGTIVLFARKYIDDAEAMGEKAAKQGARVVVISLDSVPDAAEAMADMARASGGQARAFSLGELESFVDKLPPPE